MSFESTQLRIPPASPKLDCGRPLQTNFLASESNATFPVGHLDALQGISGKNLNLQLLSYLELLNFHVLCEMFLSKKSQVSKREHCVCFEHLALGNAQYLQPGNHNLKQSGLLTPASSKMQSRQSIDSVRVKHLSEKYCPKRTQEQLLPPTSFPL